jgi:hypothetical protein
VAESNGARVSSNKPNRTAMAVATSCSTPVTNRTAIAYFRQVTVLSPARSFSPVALTRSRCNSFWARLDRSTAQSNSGNDASSDQQRSGLFLRFHSTDHRRRCGESQLAPPRRLDGDGNNSSKASGYPPKAARIKVHFLGLSELAGATLPASRMA